jgi:hypothetical protein
MNRDGHSPLSRFEPFSGPFIDRGLVANSYAFELAGCTVARVAVPSGEPDAQTVRFTIRQLW